MGKTTIQVTMFGGFQMTGPKGVLDDDIIRSDQITKLLTYILLNHKKNITIQELGDALWEDDESDNRAGALKNLMYRLRNTLKKNLGEEDYILTGRGTYYWNPDIPIWLDCEEFDSWYTKGKMASGEEQMECCQNAVQMYKGTLLPKMSLEHWTISLSTYYHSHYLSLIKIVAEIHYKNKQYEEMEAACKRAISLDSLDEELHYLMIQSLEAQGKNKLALEHYSKAVDILYENLGVRPSRKLQEAYERLLKETNEQELDLGTIQQDLLEASRPEGVFVCEYGIFREIYRLQARQAQHFGMSVYVALVTLEPPGKLEPGSEEYLLSLKKGMEHLGDTLRCLRAGDVASKYSGAQYVILLPTCTYETGKMVIERLLARFFDTQKWSRYSVHYSLSEIGMAGMTV